MREVALTERHEEANASDALQVLGKRLNFLVMQKIHILLTDLVEVVDALNRHRLRLHPMPVLPVATLRGNFADVDFGIEIGRKRIAMVAPIAVEDIQRLNRVEIVLLRIGREDLRYAGVESTAENRRQATSRTSAAER